MKLLDSLRPGISPSPCPAPRQQLLTTGSSLKGLQLPDPRTPENPKPFSVVGAALTSASCIAHRPLRRFYCRMLSHFS